MIAVDWGTSRVRAWRLAEDGRVRERKALDAGVMAVARNEFASILDAMVGAWCAEGEGPLFLCGMVGGRQGWTEVPYVKCPASLDEIAAGVRELRWKHGIAYIVPGLHCEDAQGMPDLLRGEESQALGAMALLPPGDALLCLPGTHSKHVRVSGERIAGFETYMTGEAFAVLLDHSILGRLAEGRDIDPAAFEAGVANGAKGGALSHQLFGVRTRAITGELAPQQVAGYLSGVLVGHEVANLPPRSIVHVAAEPALRDLYLRALAATGRSARELDADVAAAGIYRLARTLGTRAAA